MALKKVAPSALWTSRTRGASREDVPWIYDAALDAYVLTPDGGDTDAGFVEQSGGSLLLTAGATRSRTFKVGAAPARVL